MFRITPEKSASIFWGNIAKAGDNECWLWTRSTNEHGYGKASYLGKLWKASRLAWFLTNGPIPDGLNVLHRCDNPPCCNPAHLFLGTFKDNTQDALAKGRLNLGDRHPSKTHPHRIRRGDEHFFHLHPQLNRGERNGAAKLTAEDVIEIRARHARTGENANQISKDYPVARATIGLILKGKNWPHLLPKQ